MVSSQDASSGVSWPDRLGTWASAACVVHCLLTPVLLSSSVFLVHWLPAEEGTHRALACVVAALGAVALGRGFRRHRRWRVLGLMAAGLALIATAAWAGDRLPTHADEVALTMLGSGLMIVAHRLNHTFCRRCVCVPAAARGQGGRCG